MNRAEAIKLVEEIGKLIDDKINEYHSDNEFRSTGAYLIVERMENLLTTED